MRRQKWVLWLGITNKGTGIWPVKTWRKKPPFHSYHVHIESFLLPSCCLVSGTKKENQPLMEIEWCNPKIRLFQMKKDGNILKRQVFSSTYCSPVLPPQLQCCGGLMKSWHSIENLALFLEWVYHFVIPLDNGIWLFDHGIIICIQCSKNFVFNVGFKMGFDGTLFHRRNLR